MNNQNSNGYRNHNHNNNNNNNRNGQNGHFSQDQMQTNPSTESNNNNNNNKNNNNMQELGKQTWEALQKLHSQNTSNSERTSADKFLSKYLPNQACCWQIFSKFLTTDNIPHEAHFFAANMLRSKIQRNLHEVPNQYHIGLHDMIMNTLINFNKKGEQYENVRTQLSIALALLGIQRIDWINEVSNIITKLAKPETLDILLNILIRFPEELYTFHIPISSKIKHKASNILRQHAQLVLKLLHDLFKMVTNNNSPNQIPIKLKIFKCFAAWLDFMDTNFKDYMTNYNVLTKICFDSLENDLVFKEACTCISKILRLSDGDTRRYYINDDEEKDNNNNSNDIDELQKRQFNILVPNIIKLKEMYSRSILRDDREKCFQLCRLFVDTGEHYCDWIIEGKRNAKESKELINIILLCSSHIDPIISTYVCMFWERLFNPFFNIAREFKRRANANNNNNGITYELQDEFNRPWPDWCLPYVSINNGLIIRICHNTVISSKLPIDFEDMDIDEQEESLNLRWQLADIISDVCAIIGLYNVFNILYKMLTKNIENIKKNNNNNSDIYECEAILFCIRSSFKSEPICNNKCAHPLYKIFKLIPLLPSNIIIINKICIELISHHCNFIHPLNDIEIFEYLYKYIFNGLLLNRISRESVKAIKEICRRFEADLFPNNFIISLFNIYDSNNLCIKDEVILIESITTLISTFKNNNNIKQGINKLLNKQIIKLKQHITQNTNNTIDIKNDYGSPLWEIMNCISCIFKYFKCSSSGNLNVLLLEEIWPSIKLVLTTYTSCDNIMEKTTRIIKHVIRNNNNNSQYFMKSNLCIEILKLITILYCNKSQRSSFLYVIWTYVDEYIEKNEQAAKELIDTLIKISHCTFNILSNSEKEFNLYHDIVEDFYELLVQYIKKSNKLLTQNKQSIQFLYGIFKKAIYGILLNQMKANDAICQFYIHFLINIPDEINDQLLFNNNNQIIQQILYKILYGLSGQVTYEIANNLNNLLNEFYRYNKNKIKPIIIQVLQNNIHFQNIKCDDPNINEFIQEYFNTKYDSKKRMKITMEWYNACQRYLRSKTF